MASCLDAVLENGSPDAPKRVSDDCRRDEVIGVQDDHVGGIVDDADISGADLRFADLRNVAWKQLKKVTATNVAGVKNAPEGFVEWALQNGAVVRP